MLAPGDARRMAKIAGVAGCASALACGASWFASRRAAESLDPEIRSRCPEAAAAYPALCAELTKLARLGQTERFREILALVGAIARIDRDDRRGGEYKIARRAVELRARMRAMVEATAGWESERLFADKRVALEDALPAIHEELEAIVHNKMLRSKH